MTHALIARAAEWRRCRGGRCELAADGTIRCCCCGRPVVPQPHDPGHRPDWELGRPYEVAR